MILKLRKRLRQDPLEYTKLKSIMDNIKDYMDDGLQFKLYSKEELEYLEQLIIMHKVFYEMRDPEEYDQ